MLQSSPITQYQNQQNCLKLQPAFPQKGKIKQA